MDRGVCQATVHLTTKSRHNWAMHYAGARRGEITQCVTERNYEPYHARPLKMERSWWRVLTKCGQLEKGLATPFSILALRTPWTVWKGRKIGHWKMSLQVSRCPICYWGRTEKYLQKEWRGFEPKRKRNPVLDTSGGKGKYNAVKNSIA